jgi:CubicO group peptidase (beta-lactamase class C family)
VRTRLLAALLAGTLVTPVAAQDQKAREFDAYVTRAVKDWGAVGLAVAVVKDGQLVFAKGYGVRELGKPDAVDANTLFAIGSTTKAITAAAVGMLVDEGKLRWDDPVAKHLPDFQVGDPYLTRNLVIRDLLTHDAGLANGDVLWYETDLSPDEILRRARFIPVAYSMRSSFIYQNVMYAAAGAVVARVSGMPWQEFVRTRVFTPLGMSGAVPLHAETIGKANVAAPHDLVRDTLAVIQNASVDVVGAAGSIWAGVTDMSKWLRFMIDSGRVEGKALLRPATWRELLTPQTMVNSASFYPSARLTKPHWTTYGLGWFQQDYAGKMLNFHTGSIDGMIAMAGIIPDDRFGVYVLANRDHVEVRHALLYQAIDHWLGTGSRDWSAEFLSLYGAMEQQQKAARTAAEAARVTGTSPSLPLEKYAGFYADSLAGRVEVKVEGSALRVIMSSKWNATLSHWHYDTFRAESNRPWQGPFPVTFAVDAQGGVARMEVMGRTYTRAAGR